MARDPDDSVELALEELERAPLPERTRDHSAPAADDEIEIVDAEDGGSPAPAPEASREIPAEEGIEALRARLQASESARQQADQRAQQAEQARAHAAGAAQASDVQFLETALGGVRQGINVLKGQLSEAYAVQDFAAVADLQTEISRHTLRESQIEAGLESLKAQPAPRAAAPPPPQDQVEAVASQLSPNAAAWVRSHPQYVTDSRLNAKLMSAHYAAAGEGLALDSPEYIQHVERTLGLGGASPTTSQPRPGFVDERTPVAESRPRAPPPAAPVSRTNGGSNPTRVTLTREEREMARELFPDELQDDPSGRKSEQAYARNKLILQREKRLN